jgi:uncharacterized protein YbjQ (UPF0145 family)
MPDHTDVLLVTTDTIPGYTIEKVLGLVVGDGHREDARPLTALINQAESKGANAVVGVRFAQYQGGSSPYLGPESYLFAYGTAVMVRPA